MLDLEPVNNALENIQQTNVRNQQRADVLDERTYQRGRDQRQDARVAQSDARERVKWFGTQAAAVDRMQGPQRAAAWQHILSQHPDHATLTPDYMDPIKGPALVAAEAGQWRDPREDRLVDLSIQEKQAQIGALNRKAEDPIEALLVERLRTRAAPAGAAPTAGPRPPMLQPQSYQGGPQMPGVQLIADETQAPDQTQPVEPQAQPGMIDTPFGPMSEQEARDLAGPMLLNPKYAPAGKAILDSIDASGGGKLAKPTVNQIEERTMNAASQLGRIADIRKRFDSSYLKVPNRVQMLANAWTAKAGGTLSPDQQKELTNYAAFRSAAVNNLNTILKELSGAAVTPQEYERIQSDVPTAGTGIFDGDDPVSFKAKLDRTEQTLRMAIARQNFMRSQGLNFTRDTLDQFLALDDVPAAIDRRGAEIEQRLLQTNPKLDPMQLDKVVRGQLKREFGI